MGQTVERALSSSRLIAILGFIVKTLSHAKARREDGNQLGARI
jgi:hypothetical protein